MSTDQGTISNMPSTKISFELTTKVALLSQGAVFFKTAVFG